MCDLCQTWHCCRTAQEVAQFVICSADGIQETLPVMKETLVELTLGWSALWIWVFVAKITDRSSRDWTFCKPMKQQWTWSATCCDWVKKRCCYGVLESNQDPPSWPILRWENSDCMVGRSTGSGKLLWNAAWSLITMRDCTQPRHWFKLDRRYLSE
jgi:hypothetical protein